MKVLSILLILTVLMSAGCKTQKIAPKPEPVKSESVSSEPVRSETVARSYGNTTSGNSAVRSKEERFTAAQGEASDLGSKRFYLILGSFGKYDNALRLKKQLTEETYSPGILVNEAGLYRVCVSSFNDPTIITSTNIGFVGSLTW